MERGPGEPTRHGICRGDFDVAGHDLLEWLAVLRMNSAWMQKRMKIFAGLLKCVDLRATEGFVVLN